MLSRKEELCPEIPDEERAEMLFRPEKFIELATTVTGPLEESETYQTLTDTEIIQ